MMSEIVKSIIDAHGCVGKNHIILAYVPCINVYSEHKMNSMPNPACTNIIMKRLKQHTPIIKDQSVLEFSHKNVIGKKINSDTKYFISESFLLDDYPNKLKSFILTIDTPVTEHDLPVSTELHTFRYAETIYNVNDTNVVLKTTGKNIFYLALEKHIDKIDNIDNICKSITELEKLIPILVPQTS